MSRNSIYVAEAKEYALGVQGLLVKLGRDFPTEPVGTPFPAINGPKNLDTPIGIVGAGPSGIHMAYSLKKAGYK